MSGAWPDLTRPAWAEEAGVAAYELAIVVVDKKIAPDAVQTAVLAALRRLHQLEPHKSFGPVRFERMPWGLYAQVLVVEGGPALSLVTVPVLAAASFAWFSQRKEQVAALEGGGTNGFV